MEINFFEEFPTKENLDKLKMVSFNSTIYVAARSFKEFASIKENIRRINPEVEAGYWPILQESYWISPFSPIRELRNLYSDLLGNRQSKPLRILIDLEFPLGRKPLSVSPFSFFRNKRLIERIFKHSKKLSLDVLTAEYCASSKLAQKKLEMLGVSYPAGKYHHRKIVMFYSSMIKNKHADTRARNRIRIKSKELGEKLQIGLGAIATGISGKEPILSPKGLEEDLDFCRNQKIDAVVIFRLGGLDSKYLEVIRKYL